MLESFAVQGFRNFGNRFSLKFSDTRDYRFNADALSDSLVKCGLIYGRNAVGKTNFGNALFDIKSNIGSGISLGDERNYLNADADADCAFFEYRFRFAKGRVTYFYGKTSRNALVREKLFIDDALIFDYKHLDGQMISENLAAVGAQSLNWSFLGKGMSVFNYVCNNTPPDRLGPLFDMYTFVAGMNPISDAYMSNRSFVRRIVERVIANDRVEALGEFLLEFGIGERLTVVESPAGDPVLYFVHDRLIPFVENCSSGTVALLRLFNYYETVTNPSLLFVDEFDAFYHHDLAEKVLKYFKANIHQVLCASHNTDLFSNKVLRPDCLYILSRDSLTSAANATKRELREGHNLEKLYKAGEFDG